MSRRAVRVSPGEMEILGMLWAEGPLSLRTAHERFGSYGKPVSYPTMQTRLNRLAEKGLVARSEDRPACYRTVVTRDQVTVGHLRELISKLSGGDIVPLVARLLTDRALTDLQIAQLKQLLEEAQKRSESRNEERRTS